MMSLLLACTFGLSRSPAPDTGTFTIPGNEETTASVADRVYAISPPALSFTEPAGLGPIIGELFDQELLLYVGAVGSGTMTLAGTLAAADGRQDPCERIVWFPPATWDNPWFGAGPTDWAAQVGGEPMTFHAFHLSGKFSDDGTRWTNGRLDAVLDARDVDAALPEGLTTCEVVEAAGGACEACDDGAVSCVRLTVEITEAVVRDLDFDVNAGSCG